MHYKKVLEVEELAISETIRESIINHATEHLPNESCGLLASEGIGRITEVAHIPNVESSPISFKMEPKSQVAALMDFEDRGLEWAAIWHSHPSTEAYPSKTDINQSKNWKGIHMLIVSLKDDKPIIKAYIVDEGVVIPKAITWV